MVNVVVAGAYQNGSHTLLGINPGGQFPGNGKRHIFLTSLVAPYRARVVPTVPGIDCDNDVAARAAMTEARRVKPDLALAGYLSTQPFAAQERVDSLRGHLVRAGLQ